MNRNEMLAMYFIHDGGETNTWKLKPHGHKYFWAWVSEWAIMLCKPADIGFPMDGYNLPELNLIERKIITEERDNGSLFNDIAVSATNFNQELRLTKIQRLDEVAKIVNNSSENFIIWIKQNEEGEALKNSYRNLSRLRDRIVMSIKKKCYLVLLKINSVCYLLKQKLLNLA